jgi:isopentenyldiphosphate isomerase
VVDVWEYVALDEEEVQLDPEEVQWGEFMPLQEVHERVAGGQWAFVPDGLLVWGHQLDYWEKERQQ